LLIALDLSLEHESTIGSANQGQHKLFEWVQWIIRAQQCVLVVVEINLGAVSKQNSIWILLKCQHLRKLTM
jgi:hypothetical protein